MDAATPNLKVLRAALLAAELMLVPLAAYAAAAVMHACH